MPVLAENQDLTGAPAYLLLDIQHNRAGAVDDLEALQTKFFVDFGGNSMGADKDCFHTIHHDIVDFISSKGDKAFCAKALELLLVVHYRTQREKTSVTLPEKTLSRVDRPDHTAAESGIAVYFNLYHNTLNFP